MTPFLMACQRGYADFIYVMIEKHPEIAKQRDMVSIGLGLRMYVTKVNESLLYIWHKYTVRSLVDAVFTSQQF